MPLSHVTRARHAGPASVTLLPLPLLLALASPALAEAPPDADPDVPDCAARWSILRPTPDACLHPIETDRPHLTETPHPVPAGRVQLESGLALFDRFRGEEARVFFFENIYKLGIVTGVDVEVLHTHFVVADGAFAFVRDDPLILRSKIRILEGEGARPTLTAVPMLGVPLRAGVPVEPGLLAFLGWDLPLGMEVEVNLGATIRAQGPVRGASMVAGVAWTFPVWGPLGGYAELYTVGPHTPEEPWNVLTGGGLTWRVHRDVQLDTGVWVGVVGDVSPVIPFVGLSFRR
jgi:hypothetical protein